MEIQHISIGMKARTLQLQPRLERFPSVILKIPGSFFFTSRRLYSCLHHRIYRFFKNVQGISDT